MTVHIVPTGDTYPTPQQVGAAVDQVREETDEHVKRWLVQRIEDSWAVKVVTQ